MRTNAFAFSDRPTRHYGSTERPVGTPTMLVRLEWLHSLQPTLQFRAKFQAHSSLTICMCGGLVSEHGKMHDFKC